MLSQEIENAQRSVGTDAYQMSVGEIVSMYDNREIVIDPEFQRLFRWDIGQKSKLIESLLLGIPLPPIFSGMARAVIHNSDYKTLDHAKAAVDRYFADRNAHFMQHPRRAGAKIWGREREDSCLLRSKQLQGPPLSLNGKQGLKSPTSTALVDYPRAALASSWAGRDIVGNDRC